MKRLLSRKPQQRTVFAGAQVNRLTADWIFAPIQSANQDIKSDHRRLVARAREMAKNDPLARRFLALACQNIVGHEGIRLQARVKKSDGNFDSTINDAIEAAWEEWAAPELCTADASASWVDVQHRAVEDWKRDGEAIIRMLPGFANKYGFALQMLDADQLDVEFNVPASRNGNEVVMGVEIDKWNRPVAYWFWTAHPSDPQRDRDRTRIPAEQVIHLFKPERPGAKRGITKFAAVMMRARMLSGYAEAELVAARTGAAKMGFFEETGEGIAPDPNKGPTSFSMEADPGTFERLPSGLKFTAWDPQHPTTAYDPFTKAITREIAAGLDVSYASLSGDVSEVNYSSIRAGLLVERDVWRTEQKFLITHLHTRVYNEWFKYATASGALKLPLRNVDRWNDHVFLPRGWAWVDPMKDIEASMLAVSAGIDSRQRIAAEQGRDFEEVLADLDRENQLAKAYNVTLSTGEGNGKGTEAATDAIPDGEDRARLRLARGI